MTELVPVAFRKGRPRLPRLSEPYQPGKRSARYWTEAEIAVVRDIYPTLGPQACLARLPAHRDLAGVYNQARKLGLAAPSRGAPRGPRRAAPELDDRIRARWPELAGRGAVAAFAAELGVPRHWLSSRALKLGLVMPHKKEPPWTAAEDALLAQVPRHDPKRAAQIFAAHGFRRTPAAIMVRCKRRGLSRRYAGGWSATAAARIFGIDSKTVTGWCIAGDLPATKRPTQRLPQQGGDPWEIARADLRRFIIDHLARLDFRKVDKFAVVDLLVEPDDPNGVRAPAAASADRAGADERPVLESPHAGGRP